MHFAANNVNVVHFKKISLTSKLFDNVCKILPVSRQSCLLCWHVPFKRQTVMVIVVVGNNANRAHGSVHSNAWFHRGKYI